MKFSAKSAYDAEGRRKYLSKAEGQKFLRHAALLPRPSALFCVTLYYTGCRISEALSLRAADIDSAMNAMLIRSLKKRGKHEVRRIPIPEFLATQLLKIASSASDERVWAFSRTTGWRMIKRVMSDANIFGVHATAKGLRHGFGVRGALGQVPLPLIQNWMGHADASTTAIYLAVQDDEERELIRKTW
jgi:integrase/recombinase XerD